MSIDEGHYAVIVIMRIIPNSQNVTVSLAELHDFHSWDEYGWQNTMYCAVKEPFGEIWHWIWDIWWQLLWSCCGHLLLLIIFINKCVTCQRVFLNDRHFFLPAVAVKNVFKIQTQPFSGSQIDYVTMLLWHISKIEKSFVG